MYLAVLAVLAIHYNVEFLYYSYGDVVARKLLSISEKLENGKRRRYFVVKKYVQLYYHSQNNNRFIMSDQPC